MTPDWQEQVDQLIAQGEFARAEKVMKSLPKKVRVADAVRIDSLRTIMQRIRTDFRITPEEGVKKIREKIEYDTSNPQYIETIWGVGYRFKV